MVGIPDDGVIQTFPSDRPYNALDQGVLPLGAAKGPICRSDVPDIHFSEPGLVHGSIDGIIVAKEEFWRIVLGSEPNLRC